MERTKLGHSDIECSRIGLGTWAMGGWMWGGTDEARCLRAIAAALDHGIDLIDTAPAYGAGRAEEIVGKALAQELKRSGFRFVGPTTAYAMMQAAGLVNDHLAGCAFRGEVSRAQQAARRALVR